MAHQRRLAIVDGANIAYLECTRAGKPKVSNIMAVRKALEEWDYDCVIVVDASLRHDIDDPEQLEALIDNQRVRQVPARTDADYFVLALAEEFEAIVISNDLFAPYHNSYPWIEQRRIPLMIVNGHVQLEEPRLEKNGDRLENAREAAR